MAKGFFSRGFLGRRREVEVEGRLPPGQYLADGFPVLSAGPTPYTAKDKWDFTVVGAVETPQRWSWDEFQTLPRETVTVDIHCVTKWSKFDTRWSGFSLDTILGIAKPQAQYLLALCDGGYITNLPLADVMGNKAWIVDTYDGLPLPIARRAGAPLGAAPVLLEECQVAALCACLGRWRAQSLLSLWKILEAGLHPHGRRGRSIRAAG